MSQRSILLSRYLGPIGAVGLLVMSSCTSDLSAPRVTTPTPQPTVTISGVESPASSTSVTSTSAPRQPPETDADHAVGRIADVEEFVSLAQRAPSQSWRVKFVIPDFRARLPGAVESTTGVRWFDSVFYDLHDEWYWFELLNGREVQGSLQQPVEGMSFEVVSDVYTWLAGQDAGNLPLRLRVAADGRMYSNDFYDLALNRPRAYGLGSVIHVPATVTGDSSDDGAWLLELAYVDEPTETEVETFFDRLGATLPEEISSRLELVARSPQQRGLGQGTTYVEVAPRGLTSVHNEAIAIGRLRLVGPDGDGLGEIEGDDIVLLTQVEGWLPPSAGVLSAELLGSDALERILAGWRGVPVVEYVDLAEDLDLWQLERVNARAVMLAQGGRLEVVPVTVADYESWQRLPGPVVVQPPRVIIDEGPSVLAVSALAQGVTSQADLEALQPLIGGVGVQLVTVTEAAGLATPDRVLAISTSPYVRHLAHFSEELALLLNHEEFTGSMRIRYLLLEGRNAYEQRFRTETDRVRLSEFTGRHPPGSALGRIVVAGGLRSMIEGQPVDPTDLEEIETALGDHYGAGWQDWVLYRPSSTADGLGGFRSLVPDSTDSIVQAWSSYWGAAAFEERHWAGIDHLTGAVAVVVHPEFAPQDPTEKQTFAYSILPPSEANLFGFALDGDLPTEDRAVVLSGIQATALAILDRLNESLPEHNRHTALTVEFDYHRSVVDGVVVTGLRLVEPPQPEVPAGIERLAIPGNLLARAHKVNEVTCSGEEVSVSVVDVVSDPLARPRLGQDRSPFVAEISVNFVVGNEALSVGFDDDLSLTWNEVSADHPGLNRASSQWDLHVETMSGEPLVGGVQRIEVVPLAEDLWEYQLTGLSGQKTSGSMACRTEVLWTSPDGVLWQLLEAGR